MLPLLISTYLISKFFNLKNLKFVYDIHDIFELNENSAWWRPIAVKIYNPLEAIAFRLKITFITVSQGLSNHYSKIFGRVPLVVHSIPQFSRDDIPTGRVLGDPLRIVYFGQIKEERMPVEALKYLVEKNCCCDLYGYFSKNSSSDWQNQILNLVRKSGGQYHGRYSPDNLNFLKCYDFSLMIFPSDRVNIRCCLPNKLFQSLLAGVPCIISDNLFEVRSLFGETGYTVTLDQFGENHHLEKRINLTQRLLEIKDQSVENFDLAVSGEYFNGTAQRDRNLKLP
jgi:hypothetical protein